MGAVRTGPNGTPIVHPFIDDEQGVIDGVKSAGGIVESYPSVHRNHNGSGHYELVIENTRQSHELRQFELNNPDVKLHYCGRIGGKPETRELD